MTTRPASTMDGWCCRLMFPVPAPTWDEAARKGVLRRCREAGAQAVTVAASTAAGALPMWVISTLWGLACSATGMVMVSTPSW